MQVSKEVKGQDLAALAEEKWTTNLTLEGERGGIFDREGDALAEEVQSYTAFAILDEDYEDYVENPKKTAEKLAPVIEMEEGELEELLKRDAFQVELGSKSRYLTLTEKEAIEDLELPGIHFRTEPKRYYPNQMFASHVIGYTERDMSAARLGLEKGLNEELSSKDGSLSYQRNVQGIPLLDRKEVMEEPENGDDVHLTIDSNIQTALEQAMTEVEDEYNPEKITAIVANAESGEILGMSNRPSFNPNEYESIENYTNYAISDRIEPGSTMKMFTLAAAIEEGVYNGSEMFESGSYNIGSTTISDHNNGEGWGTISYNEGLQRSSNVAFAKLALEKLHKENLYNYLGAFGLDEKTGIDLPGESGSSIAELNDLNAGITAFGQASAFTPIQLVQAATAIANDGQMMKPYVIDKIYDPDSKSNTYTSEPEAAGKPISEKTAADTRELLKTVVTSENGTGRPFAIDGIDIAGKTGTAQISDPEGGGYLSGQNQNIFSFIGMAPADDPSIIVYVAVDRPELEPTEAGSAPVSQIFNPVMKQSLSYMNLTPDDVEDEEVYEEDGIEAENYVGRSPESVSAALEDSGLDPVVVGEGAEIEAQYPNEGDALVIGQKVMLLTNGEPMMPDMSGWSLRDAKRMSDLLGLELHHLGSGYVSKQSTEPGASISNEGYITVELQTREEAAEAQREEEEGNTESSEEEEEGNTESSEEEEEVRE
ncbi:penicillin-binding protein [Alteribacillus sp. HJP-4]|uniref:penicillin-binding protein n=1 Tax=Alteribacillus sp. HJP-4 TaxID=2775394 RepID=UPI0035CCCC32